MWYSSRVPIYSVFLMRNSSGDEESAVHRDLVVDDAVMQWCS